MQNGNESNKLSVKSVITGLFNKNTKKLKTIIVVFLVIIVCFIFLSSFKKDKTSNIVETKKETSLMAYCEQQENRLEYVLGQIKGIENVRVFLITDSSPTIKYLEETKTESVEKDEKTSVVTETKIVMAKNGSLTSPVVVVEMYPKITGVLVVAKGAGEVKMKNNLINTISAILNIKVSCVEVLEGK